MNDRGGGGQVGIRVEGLGFDRGGRPVLEGIDLALEPGERLAILGPNGAGKTTLLRLIAGLVAPGAGRVLIDGALASEAGRVAIPPHRRGIGMVFQSGALWPHMTVAQHLRFAAGRMQPDLREARCDLLLHACALDALRDRHPDQLSGGEQRRLGLARALAGAPRWLLLDEPLVNLDRDLAARLRETIDHLASVSGVGILLVTHDVRDAEALGCARYHLEPMS